MKQQTAPKVFLALLLVLVTLGHLQSPGTTDMGIWLRWAYNARVFGVVDGFSANQADYPPLSTAILLAATWSFGKLGLTPFVAIKLAIILALFVASAVFWLWTRNAWLAAVFHLSLLLNSAALGYLDIFVAPGLLLSLWALKERRPTFFGLSFAVTCLVKFQPIIIAPFFLLYIMGGDPAGGRKRVALGATLARATLPAAAILGPTLLAFGFAPLWQALKASLSHEFLSGNALNLAWVVTHYLHVAHPGVYGPLVDGEATYIMTESLQVTLIPRLLFFGSYLVTLVAFLRRDRTFANLLLFSLLGYMAYFTFNTGVHENHLFIASILAIVLFWVTREYLLTAATVVLMSNVNLYLFYGATGTGLGFSRVVARAGDVALWLSLFNVAFFLYLWGSSLLAARRAGAASPAGSGERSVLTH